MIGASKRTFWLAVLPLVVTAIALVSLGAASLYILSGIRAYVGGEGLWSKSQKDAIVHVVRYARSGEAIHWQRYQAAIAVPLGDRVAREALDRPDIDRDAARRGFLQGGNHPEDVDSLIALFLRLRNVSYMARAIDIWQEGDRLIAQVTAVADKVRAAVQRGEKKEGLDPLVEELLRLNDELRPLEDAFSSTLGEASRWARDLLIGVVGALGALLVAAAYLIYSAEHRRAVRAEEALRLADRRKDEFLATLAHELRNPLAPIRSAVGMLRVSPGLPEPAQQARDIIDRQSHHLARLVEDLLEVSRIEQGKLELRVERIPLREPLRDAVEEARPLIDSRAHRLSVELPGPEVVVDGDPTRLTQIVANLLGNSAKFTPQGGRIRLAAGVEGGEAVIRVTDNGIGIAAEHQPKLFRMFSQAPTARARAEGGLGIGLALVRGLVELHGGRVEARSDGDGKGAEFVVALPLAPAPALRSAA